MWPATSQYMVTMRAKQFDDWCTDFLGRHRNAVVLHLGCGMDTRAFRLHPPQSAQWYDVDQPDVIALRRKLYDDCAGYRMIGSSVTDEALLDEIPTDRPTLLVAEGLLMYLTEPEVRTLLQRVTDRFGAGELAFDTTSPLGGGRGCPRPLPRASPSGVSVTCGTSSNGTRGCASSSRPMLGRFVHAYPRRRYDCYGGWSMPHRCETSTCSTGLRSSSGHNSGPRSAPVQLGAVASRSLDACQCQTVCMALENYSVQMV